MTWEQVKHKSLPQFMSLYESMSRIKSRETVSSAWITMVAAQGKTEQMKKMLKPFERASTTEKNKNQVTKTRGKGGI